MSNISKRPGVMIVVVGPSGAGKDTLMDFAARRFETHDGIHFARRVITRSHDAGGENHDAVSEAEFARRLASREFCVSWQAHGLSYGIPASVNDRLARGETVIANGSRSALGQFKSVFATMKVVNVVARLDVLAARLESRGRESREEILLRLQRSSLDVCGDFDVTTIDNSGALETSGAAFAALLNEHIRSGQ
ncbi:MULTISPECIES: phosphonate metabolism protein/1,5-bisphosphokinase (PRPP-forming) PhnN [Rhizobium]|uniref:phosphonate metabolism protein/1,5-bisphosphokinase (PRPP-forming) PhnN n=1 Tax=Rhizobium TaxID=379 RepID=UPI001FAB4508|nr:MULTISPECIES: phosphonate metabolism protein/1,5-bisphosphokinase (PRPP-forming) PhnN [Rhizobium]